MTKTLKQLQEEFPYMCRTCGAPDQLYCYKFGHDSGLRIRLFKALIAAKREDEARIAELDLRVAGYLRDASNLDTLLAGKDAQLTAAKATIAERERDLLVQAGRSDGKNIIIRELEAKLSAEREAHAATKEELWEAQETVQQQAWELREVDQAALARQSQRAAEAAKEE